MNASQSKKNIVFACVLVCVLSCGKAAPEMKPDTRDSVSDTGTGRDTDNMPTENEGSDTQPSTERASYDTSTNSDDTSSNSDDTSTVDPNCVHPEVIKSCSNGWCRIPAGCFTAGSPTDEMAHGAYSEVQNQITFTRAFEIQQYEVTQGQWEGAGFYNPSSFGPNGNGQCTSTDCPLENINWYEAIAFANRMSELHDPPLPACYSLDGCTGEVGKGMVCEAVTVNAETIYKCTGYRLPTMYESEYATRAGTTTAFYAGDITRYTLLAECNVDANLDRIAWYCQNSQDKTHTVGQKEPNSWGLYDVAGNVSEWVDTQFNGRNSGTEPVTDPTGPSDVPDRHALRGGAWTTPAMTSII